MNKILVFFLVYSTNVFSENTIIATVNNFPITINSIKTKLEKAISRDQQVNIIENHIDNILQLQKANELNLTPTKIDLEIVLFEIAQSNNILTEELLNFDDFDLIERRIIEKLSIMNLERFVTRDLKVSEEQILTVCSNNNLNKDQKQIKIAQIIISEIDTQVNELDTKNSQIKTFLNKLASHIEKGASFEVFAKLHSQHPSYLNGGISDWLSVKGPTIEMLDSLDISEVSEIYATDFGLAIAIKVDERYISSKLKECEEQIVYKNAESYYYNWLINLRDQANIEIFYDKLLQ
jgi:peptidyl-prolyl cis-trans isomerase SurA